jgi:hypothetical protein
MTALAPIARRTPQLAAGIGIHGLLVALLLAEPTAGWAQAARAIRGTARDSITGAPLAGALVEVRGGGMRATSRTDEDGAFRVANVEPGQYLVTVIRIGYGERRVDVEVGVRDVVLTVALLAVPRALDAHLVRGDVSAIYGVVAGLPDVRRLAGAHVAVLGTGKTVTTDSVGGFFVDVKDAGRHMVRMTAAGYADRIFTIDVPKGRAAEASRMLDPGRGTIPAMEGVFRDADNRLRQRNVNGSAIVSGAEIRKGGGQLTDALRASPSFNEHGLRIGPTTCVFVDGTPRPGVSLESFRLEEIEAVEAYGQSYGGSADRSRTLDNQWPQRALCGENFRSFTKAPGGQIEMGIVKYVVIWLRK